MFLSDREAERMGKIHTEEPEVLGSSPKLEDNLFDREEELKPE